MNRFRVLRQLGAGGMGEVFEAEDTKLLRKVALKLLPASVAADPERRERFEREARAVAAFNHPNVVTIYSIEEANGTPFLTMELVDGEPLCDLIAGDGMTIARLIDISAAVADTIAAAERRGITHRDLKPANILVTPSGQVKVLDFGVAKLGETAAGDGNDFTMTSTGLTVEGRIVGTFAYMSPEQAAGRAVDSRSDMFSLGVVMYQMATGQPPFEGDTPMAVMSAVIKDTPEPMIRFRPDLPDGFTRIVERCLAKDPGRRYQTAVALRDDLEALRARLRGGESGSEASARARAAGRRRLTGAAAAAVSLALVAIAAWFAIHSRVPEGPAVSLEDARVSRLTTTGDASLAAISPDGRFVVHVASKEGEQSIWIRQVETDSHVQIVAPEPVRYDSVTISPDGGFVYCTRTAGGDPPALHRVPVLGGTPRLVLRDVESAVSFSPDGARLAFIRDTPGRARSRLVVADRDGASASALIEIPPPFVSLPAGPAWSPDGARLAVPVASAGAEAPEGLLIVEAATGSVHQLGGFRWRGVNGVAWISDGSALVVSARERDATARQLWRIGYPDGHPTPVTNDLNNYDGVSLSADSRTLVTVRADQLSSLSILSAGRAEPDVVTSGLNRFDGVAGLTWARDGRLVYTSGATGALDIRIANRDGEALRPLTADAGMNDAPAACGDGRRIVFVSTRDGRPQVWRMDLDGSSPAPLSPPGIPSAGDPLCAPGLDWVLYTAVGADGMPGLWRVPLGGGSPTRVRGDLHARGLALSPDGKSAAVEFVDAATGRPHVGVLSLDGRDAPRPFARLSTPVRWTPDGRALVYADSQGGVGNLWRQPLTGGHPTRVTRFTSDLIYAFALSDNSDEIAISRGSVATDVVLISMR